MSAKDKNKKTNCPENKQFLPVPNEVLADVVGCSVSTVKKVRSGKRSDETETGRTVVIAETMLKEGSNALIEEVKRVVKL
jgi:hypothetical protein